MADFIFQTINPLSDQSVENCSYTAADMTEPSASVLISKGEIQIVDVSNTLLKGIEFVQEKDYPVQGITG